MSQPSFDFSADAIAKVSRQDWREASRYKCGHHQWLEHLHDQFEPDLQNMFLISTCRLKSNAVQNKNGTNILVHSMYV